MRHGTHRPDQCCRQCYADNQAPDPFGAYVEGIAQGWLTQRYTQEITHSWETGRTRAKYLDIADRCSMFRPPAFHNFSDPNV